MRVDGAGFRVEGSGFRVQGIPQQPAAPRRRRRRLPSSFEPSPTRPPVHRVSSSLLGHVDPSFRALSGRLKFTARRHKFNKDSIPSGSGKTKSLDQVMSLCPPRRVQCLGAFEVDGFTHWGLRWRLGRGVREKWRCFFIVYRQVF